MVSVRHRNKGRAAKSARATHKAVARITRKKSRKSSMRKRAGKSKKPARRHKRVSHAKRTKHTKRTKRVQRAGSLPAPFSYTAAPNGGLYNAPQSTAPWGSVYGPTTALEYAQANGNLAAASGVSDVGYQADSHQLLLTAPDADGNWTV